MPFLPAASYEAFMKWMALPGWAVICLCCVYCVAFIRSGVVRAGVVVGWSEMGLGVTVWVLHWGGL